MPTLKASVKDSMIAYIMSGLKNYEIANKCGVKESTVSRYRLKTKRVDVGRLGNVSAIELIKKDIGNKFLKTSSHLLDSVSQEKINKASLSQIMIGAGIAHDHYRIEQGLSTQNIAVCLGGLVEKLERERNESYKRKEKPPF